VGCRNSNSRGAGEQQEGQVRRGKGYGFFN